MYTNPRASTWKCQYDIDPAILAFHKSLPAFGSTPLRPLPASFAKSNGLGSAFLKDESHRFGLPAYKILGASWGCYRTVTKHLGLSRNLPLDEVRNHVREKGLHFYTATDGNWGRAVARMGSLLGAQAHIYVPRVMTGSTKDKISQEGATVIVVDGDYNLAVKQAERDSIECGGLLIEDTAWPGYEEIPQWVVDGYSTMMVEVDQQIHEQLGRAPDLVVVPIGVGSLGQATVAHFKSRTPSAMILTVEPDTAACLKTSLEKGEMTTVETEDTAMCGMNCGTVSALAWPMLRDGVDASVTVTDAGAKEAVSLLAEMEIQVGPCAAATLATLVKACREGRESGFKLPPNAIVVLLGTEGPRGPGFDMS